MKRMKETFSDLSVGLSDHTPGINSSIVALVYGAEIIEKHVTYSRDMFGPDIKSSITFDELKTLSIFRNELVEILRAKYFWPKSRVKKKSTSRTSNSAR
jgi:sialic acid synthase SpsE